jgi:hypothetical protein
MNTPMERSHCKLKNNDHVHSSIKIKNPQTPNPNAKKKSRKQKPRKKTPKKTPRKKNGIETTKYARRRARFSLAEAPHERLAGGTKSNRLLNFY